MRRVVGASLLALAVGCAFGGGSERASGPTGAWSGTFRVANTMDETPVLVDFVRGRATISLPAGSRASGAVSARAERVRFAVPGRPGLVFDGRVRRARITGTVRQGALRGRFVLRRGATSAVLRQRYLGLYELEDGRHVVVTEVPGFSIATARFRITDLTSGETRGLFGGGRAYDVGAAAGVRAPVGGRVAFAADGVSLTWTPADGAALAAPRAGIRREEVRFRSGNATMAATLTLPTGPGPHPAVAFAHGSGYTPRSFLQLFADYYASRGIAVLAPDKRGVGQSGGRWPGEGANPTNVDQYARDLEAAARFLAAQPEVDRERVGVAGASQAGWIIPVAAAREPSISYAVILVGPAVTEDEQVYYSQLTTQGARPPTVPPDELERLMREATPGGTDPAPWIRRLRIPVLWVYGGRDQHVHTPGSVRILEQIRGETGGDFTWRVFPTAQHFLLDAPTGLLAEVPRSTRYAPGLFAELDEWLRSKGLVGGAHLGR
jgi:dienelactone hydrolase